MTTTEVKAAPMVKDLQGSAAQGLSILYWFLTLTGNSPVAAIVHNPETAKDINMSIAGLVGLYGVAHSIWLAYTKNKVAK